MGDRRTKGTFWISAESDSVLFDTVGMSVAHEQERSRNPFVLQHRLCFKGLSKLSRSLLFQLLKLRIDQILNTRKLIKNERIKLLDENQLKPIWLTILGLTRDLPLCMFIDHTSVDYFGSEILRLSNHLKDIFTMGNVKICMASRPNPLICREPADVPTMLVNEDCTSFDNDVLIGANLTDLARAYKPPGLSRLRVRRYRAQAVAHVTCIGVWTIPTYKRFLQCWSLSLIGSESSASDEMVTRGVTPTNAATSHCYLAILCQPHLFHVSKGCRPSLRKLSPKR